MKPYSLCILFIIISLCSCGVKPLAIGECDIETQMDKTKYSGILKHTVSNPISSSRQKQITQLYFECIYIQAMPKVLYDQFGSWSRIIPVKNSHHPILIWDNITIDGLAENITIISNYYTRKKDASTDVIVLNKNGKDLLEDDSSLQNSLFLIYFDEILQKNKVNDKTFFTKYDTTFSKPTN